MSTLVDTGADGTYVVDYSHLWCQAWVSTIVAGSAKKVKLMLNVKATTWRK